MFHHLTCCNRQQEAVHTEKTPLQEGRVPSCHMQMRHCITLPVFGIDVLLMGDLFGQSMKSGVAYHLPGIKTTDDSGLERGRGPEED